MNCCFAGALVCGLTLLLCSDICAGEPAPIFEMDVQPLLHEKCGKCHDGTNRKGGLDLTSLAGIYRGGESGDPLLGDSIDESQLWIMVEDGDMPPADEPPLTRAERDLLRNWIAGGAAARQSVDLTAQALHQHDVLPILLLRCTTCHGPQRQDGGLDLRTLSGMLAGGKSGPALVPGEPDLSLMIRRIETQACPPSELLLKFFVRRPSQAEVDKLRSWIAQGAVEEDVTPDIATTEADPLVADHDRQHWAFQPPVRPETGGCVDDFLRAKLSAVELSFAPEADRDTLIRRAYFDLHGLPPTREEWQRWRCCTDPQWYEQMLEELLASPRYGERWGRFWLDLAGYADSEGGISADPIRPVAWKYRDYVIRSFNDDKPYDRFLLEQLAGDELVDYEHAGEITDEMVDNLIATGFLRMGIDETGSRTMNFVPERLKVISDALHVVSSGLMGLTLECARCHSHKYDPLPHRDYYRFKAIFQGALDEYDWLSFKNRKLDVATDVHRQAIAATNPPLEKELKRWLSEQTKLQREIQLELLRHHYPQQSEGDNLATLAALKTADNQRTLQQKELVERLQRAGLLDDPLQPSAVLERREEVERIQVEVEHLRRRMVPPTTIRALWDAGRPSPTYVLRGGEATKPGELVGPGVPAVLTDGQTPFEIRPPISDGTPKSGRRLAFARWLTQPEHPLTARVMVNRIWFHHFGTGLVKELENFGTQSEGPSHPELLDWLATEFVESGWSVKHMQRLMMQSRAYRQESRVDAQRLERDPDNRLLSRMPLRRMEAEAVRDAMLAMANRLDLTPGGLPDPVSVSREGAVSVRPTSSGAWRRSVYLQYRRTEIPTWMDTFDYPQMGPNCLSRNISTVAPQALLLMNSEAVHELAGGLAERIEQTMRDEDLRSPAEIEIAHELVFARSPTTEQRRLGEEALARLTAAWKGDRGRALLSYCHTLFNSADFLYVD